MPWLLASAVAATIGLWPTAVRAQPRLRVRASTAIDADLAPSVADIVEIRGSLHDDLGAGIPGAAIHLRMVPHQATALQLARSTDPAGRFSFAVPAVRGTARIEIDFGGDLQYAGARLVRDVDLAKADVHLEIVAPRSVLATAPTVAVAVVARSDESVSGLPLRLLSAEGVELARGQTDGAGEWRGNVAPLQIGLPGARAMRVEFDGDSMRNSARATSPIVVVAPSWLTLEVRPNVAAPGDEAVFSGNLVDHRGPIADVAVGLFAGGRHLATARTDRVGSFHRAVPLSEAMHGVLRVTARYVPATTWRRGAESGEAEIAIRSATSVPLGWVVACVAITALVWLLARWARRAPATPKVEVPVRVRPGVHASPRARSRPSISPIAGRVLDADTPESAVAGASVRLWAGPHEVASAQADASGRFELSAPPSGPMRLEVSADGFEPAEAWVESPHRGEWSALRVALVSRRRKIERIFHDAVAPLLGAPESYAFSTAREIVARLRGDRTASPPVEQLAQHADECVYSAHAPGEADVARAVDLAAAAPSRPDGRR